MPNGFAPLDMARALQHPHVLTTVMTYEEELDFHHLRYGIILNPVANCTLRTFLERPVASNSGEWAAREVQKWLGCLGSGLSYLHAKNMTHRQLSPSNILVKDGAIFFTEFAISNHFKANDTLVEEYTEPSTSCEVYQAPELQKQQSFGTESDIFSFGCISIELLTFASGMSLTSFSDWLLQQPFPAYHHHLPRTLDWLAQVQSRLTFPALRRFISCCENMLKIDPSTRPSAFEVTRFVFNTNLELSKASGSSIKPDCDCLLPWQGKEDEPCRVVMFVSLGLDKVIFNILLDRCRERAEMR